jgi:hypothetical protein
VTTSDSRAIAASNHLYALPSPLEQFGVAERVPKLEELLAAGSQQQVQVGEVEKSTSLDHCVRRSVSTSLRQVASEFSVEFPLSPVSV